MEGWMSVWQVYALGIGRVSALVMLAPVIGGNMVPTRIKVIVVLILTLVGLGLPVLPAAPILLTPVMFSLLLVKEVLVGFAMGLTITLVLMSCQAAGEIMGFQMMFSLGSTFLPPTQERSTLVGNFFYILAILIFVTIDGHHWLIKGLHLSFQTLPILSTPHSLGSVGTWITLTGRLFLVGLQLAIPVMITLFITNLMLGMIAKTMPQLNIFIVGLPIQITVAFILIILMLPSLMSAEISLFQNWARDLHGFIRQLAP